MKEKDKKIFKTRRIISFILTLVLLIGMIPVFPKAEENIPLVDLNPNDVEMIVMTGTTDEIAIRLKDGKATNYSGKRIRIPAKIDGKKVVNLGYRLLTDNIKDVNFFHQTIDTCDTINHFPDLSQAKYLKVINQGAFENAFINNAEKNLVIKDCPELTTIEAVAFDNTAGSHKTAKGIEGELVIQDCPKLNRIGFQSFTNNNNIKAVTIKNCPMLTAIEYGAFQNEQKLSQMNSITIENCDNLGTIGDIAFDGNRKIKTIVLKDLPKLKEISKGSFAGGDSYGNSNAEKVKLSMINLPNLNKIESRAFDGCGLVGDLDLRDTGIYYIAKDAFIRCSFLSSIILNDTSIYSKEILEFDNQNYIYAKRYPIGIRFEFISNDSEIQLPAELKAKAPKPYIVYPKIKREWQGPPYDKFIDGVHIDFKPTERENFDKKYTDPSNGDEWKFVSWNTNNKPNKKWLESKMNVSYTGTWVLLLNKIELKKALEAANAKKENVVVSPDGADQPFTKLWVTQQDQNTFDAAITTAQGVFDSDTVLGNTRGEKQQYIDSATEALKQATAAYNPQEGKLNYDKNPTYAQPEGAHLVTFKAGTGVEPLTSTDKFYVKDNTALPTEQFPQATVENGFGNKIFWNPAQDTLITSDQVFTASAKAVDKTALQEKITEAERLIQNDSTSDPAVALKTVVDGAKTLIQAVDAGTERDQDKVDAKVTELGNAIQALKDLNAKKEQAKTQIASIDGLEQPEITTLQGEVNAAKNAAAVDAIIEKAQAQAQTNKAIKDATAAVEAAENDKTQEKYEAAKTKVEALPSSNEKTALENRLKEVKKYVDAAAKLTELEGKDIATVKPGELTAAENLINQVKDAWKQDLFDRLNILKTDKKASDLAAAKETARNTINALDKLDQQEKAPFLTRVNDATTIPQVDKAVLDAQKANAKKKVAEMPNLTDDQRDQANNAIDQASDETGINNAVDQAQQNQDNAALAAAKQEAKNKINALDKLTQPEKDGYNGRIDNAQNQQDIDAIVLEAQKANAKKKVAEMPNLTDDQRDQANNAIDQASDETGINNAVDQAQQNQDNAALAAAKQEAKNKINALDKLTQPEKDGYNGRIDNAQNQQDIDAIVLEAQKANAKKAVNQDNMPNLTPDQRQDAETNIDNANNEGEVNTAVDNAQNQNDQNDLNAYKASAKEKVNALDKLDQTEKDGFNRRIDEAADKASVDAIVLEAQKANAKKAVNQDNMPNLTPEERQDAETNIDNANNETDVNNAVDNAQNQNDQNDLNAYKASAKEKVNALDKLDQTEKDGFNRRIDGAADKASVDAIVLEAQKANAKKAVNQDNMPNLTPDQRQDAETNIDNANNEGEVNTAVDNAQNQNDQNDLNAYKASAKEKVNALDKLDQTEKDGFNRRIDEAADKASVDAIVLEAQKANAKKAVNQDNMPNLTPDQRQDAETNIDNANNEGEVNTAVENAQNQNDQAADPLAKAKENAKKIINGLDKLTQDEKDGYNGRIDNAQNQQDIDAIVLEAQKENAKKKIAGMDKLTDDERGEADQAIDNAHNNDDINNTVNDAQQKQNDRQSLEEHKAKAKEKVNNLDKLTPEEKDGYNGRIDQAQTKEDVDKIVLEAQKENAKKKIAEMDNLTDDDRREANQNIDNARNEDEINDAVENAGRRVEPTPSYPRYDYNPFWNIYFGSSVTNKTTTTPQPQTSVKIKLQSKLVIGSKEMIKAVDGVEQKVMMDIAPFIDSNRTMLPIRFVAEALGFKVEWDEPSRTVILTDKDNVVRIPVDTNKIIVNGSEYESDVKPVLRDNRTMLPIGNIARALGLVDGKDIIWDAATREVVIKREIEK